MLQQRVFRGVRKEDEGTFTERNIRAAKRVDGEARRKDRMSEYRFGSNNYLHS